MREQVLQYVDQYKIIAIVRGADPKQCFAVAEALYAGGIRLMEVTYDQKKPETWQATADTIGALAKEYEGRMFVGAGTVTSPELDQLLKESLEGIEALELDLTELQYISSAGLRVLLSAQKTMNKQGTMVLTGVGETVMEVFEVTGFADILTIK